MKTVYPDPMTFTAGSALDAESVSAEREAAVLAELMASAPASAANVGAITNFQYSIVPLSGGGYATRPVVVTREEDTVDSAVAAVTGLPEAKCAEVLAAYMDRLFMCSAGNRWAHAIHQMLSMLPADAGTSRVDGCAAA